MSTTDPKRLADYGDRLDRLVKGALDAERAADPDAARLAAIQAKLAARLAPAAPPVPPPSNSRPLVWAGAAMIAGLAIYALTRSPAPPPPPAPVVITVAPVAAPAPSPIEPASLPTISPSDLPSVREPSPPPSARTLLTATAPNETEEIALIARAQSALASDPAASLALCRAHAQQFANGHFAQEREAVAIEALADLHRMREARDGLNAFVARYPTSSHRAHLEALVSKSSD